MNISGVTGVAAAFEGARVAGQQQASATSNAQQTQRENDRQAEEVDLKKTDTVTLDQGTSSSGDAGVRRLIIVVFSKPSYLSFESAPFRARFYFQPCSNS